MNSSAVFYRPSLQLLEETMDAIMYWQNSSTIVKLQ